VERVVQATDGLAVLLVPATLDARFLKELPARLIGDRGYDSDALDAQLLKDYGIEMIARHRRSRRRTQDGRAARRTKRRWKIERLFAWLHNSRRLVTRWEYSIDNFLGFLRSRAPKFCTAIHEMASNANRRRLQPALRVTRLTGALRQKGLKQLIELAAHVLKEGGMERHSHCN
jgi:transposase